MHLLPQWYWLKSLNYIKFALRVDRLRGMPYNRYMHKEEEFGKWLVKGIEEGWITEPFCNTHDIDPAMGEDEQAEWEAGGDPCQHVVRLMT